MKTKRKGFAIVLVAALAGLIFLLGASLVVVTRLQTASANYDQRVRLAREHARAALDMALAELQTKLGRDTSVSYTADVYRTTIQDLKLPSVVVKQPFWTAASAAAGNESWLVTKPIVSDFNGASNGVSADPRIQEDNRYVMVLGSATAGISPKNSPTQAQQEALQVRVPKESIQVQGVDGYLGSQTIGHYAYWVGDLGVKASYAWYDKTGQIGYDGYDADGNSRERLRQIRVTKPNINFVNTNEDASTVGGIDNQDRIDRFISDFQFRNGYGDTTTDDLRDDRYLINLEEDDVLYYFHDFTPLSKGLLVNSKDGGFRENLSTFIDNGNSDYVQSYLPFAKLSASGLSTPEDYNRNVFPMRPARDGMPAIHPVLTQFNLNYTVYLEDVSETDTPEFNMRIAFAAGFELWNPFSSALEAHPIRFEVKGLPCLSVNVSPKWEKELSEFSKTPKFITPAVVSGDNRWRPGQIAVFSGPEQDNATGNGPYLLSQDSVYVTDSVSRVIIEDDQTINGYDAPTFSFSAEGIPAPASISVEMYLHDPDEPENDELLATYSIESVKFEAQQVPFEDILRPAQPTFGFSWEINDTQVPYRSTFPPAYYHPFNGSLSKVALKGFSVFANDSPNVPSDPFRPAANSPEVHLLGYNKPESAGEGEVEEVINTKYDLSVFQLPKQPVTSVGHLANSFGGEWQSTLLGEYNSDRNDWFDRYFFTGLDGASEGGGSWTISDPLPNSAYTPIEGATESDIKGADAARSLWVEGMFNVNSTSIDAWKAILKSSPVASHSYWSQFFADLRSRSEDPEQIPNSNDLFLMFNFPFGAEDRFEFEPSVTSNDALRYSLSQSMFVLEGSQLDKLAERIVRNIRKRAQGVDPYDKTQSDQGPIRSLEDFAESLVLRQAILETNDDLGLENLNQSWVTSGTPAEFKPSTILGLIAPYISARSDTFLVRAYGDAVNPAASDPASSSAIWARAYCEAIVQRVHEEYGDTATNPADTDRKFEVVAFRWLSPSEI